MKIHGACHCGDITFEAEVDPKRVAICHCGDCQTLSGAPFRAFVVAEPGDFKLLSGEPATYVKTAESGNRRAQAFCPRCGSPLYATAADNPDAPLNIRAGVVRERDQLVPKRQVWTSAQQTWVGSVSSLPGVPGQ